jgi:hypothetical protein
LAFVRGTQLVVFYYHSGDTEKETSFKVGAQLIKVNLKPKSFNTFRLEI